MRQKLPTQRDSNALASGVAQTGLGVQAPAASHRGGMLRNAMTIDVEDYFQVSAFSDQIRLADWEQYPCRVERNVDEILELFDHHALHGTFFVLGWIAERYPLMVRRIVSAGHELASHGQSHIRVHEQSPQQFREDIRSSKGLLEDIAGVPISGYRAASFSIGDKTPWAFEILADEGFAYSSSIYPIRHDLYGMPDAPRTVFQPTATNPLIEIPVSTVRFFKQNFPCGGGGYFRLLPYRLTRSAIQRLNGTEHTPCVFYFHPWEIDPEQPRVTGAPLKSRFRHYLNLKRMKPRLERLLADFSWDRMDSVFLTEGVM